MKNTAHIVEGGPADPVNFAAQTGWLTGKLLIAMPSMDDPRFARSVVYVCSHGENGAMGLIVNRLFGEADFAMLLDQLGVEAGDGIPDVPVHFGGPVEMHRGFVLHTDDYDGEGTVQIAPGIAVSASIDAVRAIAHGEGPARAVMALGYAGWGIGQLEDEIRRNGWLTADADDAILFDGHLDGKWERALRLLGISPAMLSQEAGRA